MPNQPKMHLKTTRLTYIFIVLGAFFLGQITWSQEQKEQQKDDQPPKKESLFEDDANYQSNPIGDFNEAYYIVDRLNEQIGLSPSEYNLQTPQATLEHFIVSCRNKEFDKAIYALNFNLFPKSLTKEDAAILAEKLYFVINQRVNIDWDNLSDRPDGQIDISTTTNSAVAGAPRRSLVFGEVDYKGRDIVLRLQRVRYKNYGAFWLISANTTDNIENMYAQYGPRELDLMMPNWARVQFLNVPVWKVVGTILLIVIAYFLARFIYFLVCKICKNSKRYWIKSISDKLAKPVAITIAVLFFYITLNKLISFSGALATVIYTSLLIVVVGSITWFIMQFIDYLMLYVADRKVGDVSEEENEESRKLLTYISVARRLITFLVIIIGGYIILSQFRSLEKLGISLLASAGVATVIIGVAAQSTLGNIIAGLQIAFTKPVRVGDTVIIEDDWGYVEDIKFTFMVVRTWDLRRLVVPLKYVISNTFENWSMTSSHQIRPIYLQADYRTNVSKVRSKFKELLEDHEDWDQDHPPVVQVTDMSDKTITIRALCSAKDASSTWDLHCSLREDLVRYICDLEDGVYLAKSRVENVGNSGEVTGEESID